MSQDFILNRNSCLIIYLYLPVHYFFGIVQVLTKQGQRSLLPTYIRLIILYKKCFENTKDVFL
jgi:hypothetical protein